jgi:hypothetical protein
MLLGGWVEQGRSSGSGKDPQLRGPRNRLPCPEHEKEPAVIRRLSKVPEGVGELHGSAQREVGGTHGETGRRGRDGGEDDLHHRAATSSRVRDGPALAADPSRTLRTSAWLDKGVAAIGQQLCAYRAGGGGTITSSCPFGR